MKNHLSIVNLVIFVLNAYIPLSWAHSRWACPKPRNPGTGIKQGPCGGGTSSNFAKDFDSNIPVIKPGPLRVKFEESIYHTGAPWRISLSQDGTDAGEPCILLDHIPHNDASRSPNIEDESTYTPYYITINIPDVACERCSLHLANPMTDKIGSDGAPNGKGCTDPGSCFSVYHSCTMPFKITGSVRRSQHKCVVPSDWPTVWTGDNGQAVDVSVPQLYRREAGNWNANHLLTGVPARYRANMGDCEANFLGAPAPSPLFCVSGTMTVELANNSVVLMEELRVGDMVKVGEGAYETVYGFGHREETLGDYLEFKTSDGKVLVISDQHLVFTKEKVAVPASLLTIGTVLETGSKVESVERVKRSGAYAPFTPSGIMYVNGIKISSYISLQPNAAHLTIAGVATPFSFQWLSHSFLTLHRRFGVTTGIQSARAFAQWWLGQHFVVVAMLFLPLLAVLLLLATLEILIWQPIIGLPFLFVFLSRRAIRTSSGMKVKIDNDANRY
jgi:hypothetical protein